MRLVPLGHYNWKWNEARQKYTTWEKEILSGVLTIASQGRILQNLPIVWMTDNEAATSFLKGEPPLNKRLRRMYVFLHQFKLNIVHVAGCKNELYDFLSRADFENKFEIRFEEEARNAFQKMDVQLDLFLQRIFSLSHRVQVSEKDYLNSELKDFWEKVEISKPCFIDNEFWFRSAKAMYCEGKLVVPSHLLKICLDECHKASNHVGAERTLLFFMSHFQSKVYKKDLLEICKAIVMTCEICTLSKQNRPSDRGKVGSLPIPSVCNEVLCLDFVQMDPYNGFDYVLTLVDNLSHFCQFIPTQKR